MRSRPQAGQALGGSWSLFDVVHANPEPRSACGNRWACRRRSRTERQTDHRVSRWSCMMAVTSASVRRLCVRSAAATAVTVFTSGDMRCSAR
jgi:hypothetical protein